MATRHPNNFQREIRWLIEEKYGGNKTTKAEKDIARLEKGEHVDYVVGWVDFAGCRIDLSKRPLIPRPETEFWVERAIREMLGNRISDNRSSKSLRDFGICTLGGLSSLRSEPCQTASESLSENSLPAHRSLRCLDLFAGSSCIGVAVLKHIPRAHVDFAEKDRRLLKQIKINAKLNGIDSKRYRVFRSDVFSNVKGRYDYIFANPPYVAEARKAKVQKSVLEQEPTNAVFGGKDGLYYIRKFVKKAKDYLVPGGVVYLEFDSYQKIEIAKLAKAAGAKEVDARKDQFGKWRHARIVF